MFFDVPLIFALALCGLASQSVPTEQMWLNDHFFVSADAAFEPPDAGVRAQGLLASQARVPSVCRDHIRRVLVVTGPDGKPTPGIAGGAAMPYTAFFEGLYDVLPKAHKRMFCSVSRLEIGDRAGGFLIAGVTGEGVELHFHRSLLDRLTTADDYYSWYEQIPFGADERHALTWRKDLPHLLFETSYSQVLALAVFATSHAFGHLFDWADDVTRPGSPYSRLSWQDAHHPLAISDFEGRANLRWTLSGAPPKGGRDVATERIRGLYQAFAVSGFVTLHGAESPSEDFADAIALAAYAQLPNARLWLKPGGGAAIELVSRAFKKAKSSTHGSRILREKHEFVERFLNSPDLIYP